MANKQRVMPNIVNYLKSVSLIGEKLMRMDTYFRFMKGVDL
jgi:hypothetical protein